MKWSVLTLVGADKPGIVAAVTNELFNHGCQLAQASMMRLGANFAIMLRVSHKEEADFRKVLSSICTSMNLHLHIDEDAGASSSKQEPDVQVTVYGADRSGIVAQVTAALAEAGLNIIDLETDIGGSEAQPIYIMSLEGIAENGLEPLQKAIASLDTDIEVNLDEINTLRG